MEYAPRFCNIGKGYIRLAFTLGNKFVFRRNQLGKFQYAQGGTIANVEGGIQFAGMYGCQVVSLCKVLHMNKIALLLPVARNKQFFSVLFPV